MSKRTHARMRRHAVTLLVGMLALAASTLGSCDRTPQLVPAESDSLRNESLDSLTVLMRQAQRFWEAGRGDDAARLTAEVLHADLRNRPPDRWEPRAIALLDSLNVGAEAVSSDCVMVLNLFSRSDPHGASWPHVFWCSGDTLRHQLIEGQGMRLLQAASRDIRSGDRALAVLYGRHGPAGDRPVLMAWSGSSGRWRLVQTLGSDSLGGTGTGHFEERGGGIELVTETYRVLNPFQECAGCPHVQTTRRFRWSGERFVGYSDRVEETPYAAFVRFIRALRDADYVEAMNYVSDRQVLENAVHLGWSRSRDSWRAAPGTHDRATEMIFFHGQQDAFRVWFESWGSRWVISGIDTTTRTVEVP